LRCLSRATAQQQRNSSATTTGRTAQQQRNVLQTTADNRKQQQCNVRNKQYDVAQNNSVSTAYQQ
jgi:hypothetical protein